MAGGGGTEETSDLSLKNKAKTEERKRGGKRDGQQEKRNEKR